MKKLLLAVLPALLVSTSAFAHGVAGDRVFPATVAVEDPAVADELTLPEFSRFKDDGDVWTNTSSFEWAKTITSRFGVSVGGSYIDPDNAASGWDNFELSAKYQLYRNDAHEFLLSVGVDDDMGGTGSKKVGAESFSTITPTVYFGKGLGDMFDKGSYLRPLAVTGSVGYAMPTRSSEDNATEWGATVQYSLPYLQSHVKDVGLIAPFDNLVPIVEFAGETPEHGKSTGTINPGFIWMGDTTQVSFEAMVPMNDASGSGVGGIVQLHFFLDDIFPNSLGKPVW